jgi:hypothetical protein
VLNGASEDEGFWFSLDSEASWVDGVEDITSVERDSFAASRCFNSSKGGCECESVVLGAVTSPVLMLEAIVCGIVCGRMRRGSL